VYKPLSCLRLRRGSAVGRAWLEEQRPAGLRPRPDCAQQPRFCWAWLPPDGPGPGLERREARGLSRGVCFHWWAVLGSLGFPASPPKCEAVSLWGGFCVGMGEWAEGTEPVSVPWAWVPAATLPDTPPLWSKALTSPRCFCLRLGPGEPRLFGERNCWGEAEGAGLVQPGEEKAERGP